MPLTGDSDSTIIESDRIESLRHHIQPGSVVLLDLDNTVIESQLELGSDQWFLHLCAHAAKTVPDQALAFPMVIAIYHEVQKLVRVQAIEEATVQLIHDMQTHGTPIMAITARDICLKEATIRQLKDTGIDLSLRKSPINKDPLNKEMMHRDASRLALKMGKVEFVYESGIIFCSGNDKGQCFRAFCNLMRLFPLIQHVANENEMGMMQIEFAKKFPTPLFHSTFTTNPEWEKEAIFELDNCLKNSPLYEKTSHGLQELSELNVKLVKHMDNDGGRVLIDVYDPTDLNPEKLLYHAEAFLPIKDKEKSFTSFGHALGLMPTLGHYPQHVVMADDKKKHLQNVKEAIAPLNIGFAGLRYNYLDRKVDGFKLEVANAQLAEVHQILPPHVQPHIEALRLIPKSRTCPIVSPYFKFFYTPDRLEHRYRGHESQEKKCEEKRF